MSRCSPDNDESDQPERPRRTCSSREDDMAPAQPAVEKPPRNDFSEQKSEGENHGVGDRSDAALGGMAVDDSSSLDQGKGESKNQTLFEI